MKNDFILICQFDQNYFNLAKLFIESFLTHHPEFFGLIYVNTVGLSCQSEDSLWRLHSSVVVENESLESNRFNMPMDEFPLKELMACRKAFVLQHAMQRYPGKTYIMFDVDLLVRKPLTSLLNQLNRHPYGVIFQKRFQNVKEKQINSSIIFLRYSFKHLADSWVTNIQTKKVETPQIKQWQWLWDQLTLVAAVEECQRHRLPYRISETKYLNERFSENACIWTVLGGNKSTIFDLFSRAHQGMVPEISVNQFLEYYQQGEWQLALVIGETYLKRNPKNNHVLYLISDILVRSSLPNYAIGYLERINPSKLPKDIPVYATLGLCYQSIGVREKALYYLNRSIQTEVENKAVRTAIRQLTGNANELFTHYYQTNFWGGKESLSGPGSDSNQTKILIGEVSKILSRYSIKSVLDLPCGDFFWMQNVCLDDVDYMGADIVDELIVKNQKKFGRPGKRFKKMDIIADDLPTVDLIICRDCFIHFSFQDIQHALAKIIQSKSKYLLTTTYPSTLKNCNISLGHYFPLNLALAPINFPAPIYMFNEGNTEFSDDRQSKSMGVWLIESLRDFMHVDV